MNLLRIFLDIRQSTLVFDIESDDGKNWIKCSTRQFRAQNCAEVLKVSSIFKRNRICIFGLGAICIYVYSRYGGYMGRHGWQGRGLCYLPQPSASADNTNRGLDNSQYRAQPHPITANYFELCLCVCNVALVLISVECIHFRLIHTVLKCVTILCTCRVVQ